MNTDFEDHELNEALKAHFSAAVEEQPAQPIFASTIKAGQRKMGRRQWVVGGATVLAAGIVTTLLTMTFVPSSALVGVPEPLAPAPSPSEEEDQTRTVVIGQSGQPADGEYYTDPETGEQYYYIVDPETGEIIKVIVPDPDSPQVARQDPETGQITLIPAVPGSNLPAPPKDAPEIGAWTPGPDWKTYNLKTFGISVQLPKNMVAFLDKEFDNGYRLDTKATRAGKDMKEILVWPESLAAGNGSEPPYDLGKVPGLMDAKGRQVHIGYFDNSNSEEDWAEFLLMVPDDSQPGSYDALLDFGKGKVYFGSDDNWMPLTKKDQKDRELIVAILASVKVID
ncbi:MAG: hypothetical protein LBK28_02270 [Propionibacteriaceae bacterium]|jgi:hypothetical protein|nr:hypothetical protein [Propionibacteriaceae bacterium]